MAVKLFKYASFRSPSSTISEGDPHGAPYDVIDSSALNDVILPAINRELKLKLPPRAWRVTQMVSEGTTQATDNQSKTLGLRLNTERTREVCAVGGGARNVGQGFESEST